MKTIDKKGIAKSLYLDGNYHPADGKPLGEDGELGRDKGFRYHHAGTDYRTMEPTDR